MIVSPSSFAKAIARVHGHERWSLDKRLQREIEQQSEPIRKNFQQRIAMLDREQKAERHLLLGTYTSEVLLGTYSSEAPDYQTAMKYLERDGLICSSEPAPAPNRERSGLVPTFNEQGLQSPFFQRRSEQIKIQMSDWRKAHAEKENDIERSR